MKKTQQTIYGQKQRDKTEEKDNEKAIRTSTVNADLRERKLLGKNLVEKTVGTLRKEKVSSCLNLEYSGKQRYEHSWLINESELIKYLFSVTVLPPDSEQ